MGYPQDWTNLEGKNKRNRFAALGNSIVPQIAVNIFKSILHAENKNNVVSLLPTSKSSCYENETTLETTKQPC